MSWQRFPPARIEAQRQAMSITRLVHDHPRASKQIIIIIYPRQLISTSPYGNFKRRLNSGLNLRSVSPYSHDHREGAGDDLPWHCRAASGDQSSRQGLIPHVAVNLDFDHIITDEEYGAFYIYCRHSNACMVIRGNDVRCILRLETHLFTHQVSGMQVR